MQDELRHFSENNDSKQKAAMLAMMNDHYSQIKNGVGLIEKNIEVVDDSQIDEVLDKLQDNSCP